MNRHCTAHLLATSRLPILISIGLLSVTAWCKPDTKGSEQATIIPIVAKQHRQVDNQSGEVGENPRQRLRLLDKRNPVATEYQSISDIGQVMLANIDSEGINNRARFPAMNLSRTYDRTLTGDFSYNYSDLSRSGVVQGKGSFEQVLDKAGRWAVAVNAERTGIEHAFDRALMRWRPHQQEGRSIYFLDRLRISRKTIKSIRNKMDLSFYHKPSDQHHFYLRAQDEDRDDEDTDQRSSFSFGEGEIEALGTRSGTAWNAVAQRSVRDLSEKRKVRRVLAGGSYRGETYTSDYSLYSASWERNRIDNINPVFRLEGVDFIYALDDPALPDVQVNNEADLADLSQYRYHEVMLRDIHTIDEDLAFQANYRQPLKAGGVFLSGILYREKERENIHDQVTAEKSEKLLSLDMFAGREVGLVLRDRYDFGREINRETIRNLVESNPTQFLFDPRRSRLESDTNNYTASESVLGAYLLRWFRGNHWSVQAGLRFEQTQIKTTGNRVLTDALGNYISTEPVAASNDYSHWFPSLALEYKRNDKAKLTVAWYRTLARPNYFDLVPYRRIAENIQFISEGNSNLQPTKFDHLLVATHVQGESVGSLTITSYYKKLNSFFFNSTVLLEGGQYDGWSRRRTENGNDAILWGVELGWRREARFLPSTLGKLNLTAFYTFSETTAKLASRPGEKLALPERSRHSVVLSTDHRFGPLRTTLSFKYRSHFLDDIGDAQGMDEFMDDAFSLNLAFQLNLSTGIQSYVRLVNLTDHPQRSYEGIPDRISDNQYGSWKAIAGIRFTF